jgi:hypothetical protein
MVKENKQKHQHTGKVKRSNTFDFLQFVNGMLTRHNDQQVDIAAINDALRNSLSVGTLINNLAEIFRIPPKQIEQDLRDFGFKALIDQYKLKTVSKDASGKRLTAKLKICDDAGMLNPFPELFKIKSAPNFLKPVSLPKQKKEILFSLFQSTPNTFSSDPFLKLYREGVMSYFQEYMANAAPVIKEKVRKYFKDGYPRYLVTTGIGANEQFNHFVASINNSDKNKRLTWLIIDSPKGLASLPDDADINNTLFMEFSRSSVTEETVKIHEYTPRKAHRIVFSNRGPLREIGKRDGNLVLELPDQVSGRYGRNKTPILLAPMFVAGMDVESFWKDIDLAINTFNIDNQDSLPLVMAKFLLLYQDGRNMIYLGCNDDNLLLLGDEFVQFWNEGVNKDGNDLLMSRFFGLPRDSHMNIEGLLGNHKSKMAIFLLRTDMRADFTHPLVSPVIDPINKGHEGLHLGDEEAILSFANYLRFSDLMPTILFEIPGKPSLKHAAVIGQLFSDITFIYSRLKGIDPGSNPEVKAVRDRSAELLSRVAEKIRYDDNLSIDKILF